MTKIRVLLAEDHETVRQGLKLLIDRQSDMEVVGEAMDGEQAVQMVATAKPDIAILDMSMPKMNAIEVTSALKRQSLPTRVVALTVHEDTSYLRELLAAGAAGYVLKRAAAEDLNRAIRSVAAGGVYLDPSMAAKLVGSRSSSEPAMRAGVSLTDRESTVLKQIAEGYSNKHIATALGVSVKTIETYKMRAMDKLDLHSRVDVVRYAARQGWLPR